jgi:hypothetical protein
MSLWKFCACPAPGGGRPIDRFVDELGPEAENAFSTVLGDLSNLERRFWTRPQFDVLHGPSYHGMGEVIFSGDGKTYRVFGYFGPQRLHFTFLSGHVKKRDLKHEMDQAAKRRDFAEGNRQVIYEFTFDRKPIRKTEG